MNKELFIIFYIFLFAITVYGQERDISQPHKGDVFLDIRSVSFFKNNEYFNPVIEGYTLTGSFIKPQIFFSSSNRFEIGLGFHQQIYSGEPSIKKPQLLLSIRWKLTETSVLTLGAFDGSTNHKLFDPLFNTERLYTNYTENGISFVSENNRIFSDTWINWENFIFKGDTTREIFTAGESFRYSATISDYIKIYLPFQIKFKHYGGQISNYSGHVLTFFNMAAGTGMDFAPAKGNWGKTSIEYIHFFYRELTRKGDAGIIRGNASWIRLHYNYRWLYLGSYLWFSDNFFSPDGNNIYSSVSDYQPGTIIPRRRIWTSTAAITLNPGNIFEFVLGFEGYYDFKFKRMDSSLYLHLNFNRRFKITSVK